MISLSTVARGKTAAFPTFPQPSETIPQTQAGELPSGALFVYKPYETKHTARLIREMLDRRAVDPVDAA